MKDRPWADEPDRVDFQHKGLPCRIIRANPMGHLCGYVQIPETHPGYGAHYDDPIWTEVSAHGGLTFSGRHEDGGFWIGFDCAHSGDLSPMWIDDPRYAGIGAEVEAESMARYESYGVEAADMYRSALAAMTPEVYRTIEYVRSECIDLAEQVLSLTKEDE